MKLLTPDDIKRAADLAAQHARERAELAGRHENERRELAMRQEVEMRTGIAESAPVPAPGNAKGRRK